MGVSTPMRLFLAALVSLFVSNVACAEISVDISANAGGVTLDAGVGAQACTPLGKGIARASDPWWMESIKHQGTSPTNPDPSGYRPFRNVKVAHFIPVSAMVLNQTPGFRRCWRWRERRYRCDQVNPPRLVSALH